ncbi:HlyD family efflux transporter periplasmic adaptor subunit [Archangium violaceum]|uniref:efflux RND transporter periplasmic adaptor subunit n=1 Tax=Archangium violaceum TaxID=83451 RepID=UPI00194ECD58|nr:HlyD family efflux transporter periplasmic adaptor subunit [Archangium violaceum]QRN97725.1 HlyD family efflux transporter periplasmic adaptor subunit [Archangium violaceum]
MPAGPESIFRRQALEEHAAGAAQGNLLTLTPVWLRASFWVLTGALAAGVLGLVLASIDEYAEGPAFVQVEGGQDLTATASGIVTNVDVRPGQRVTAGRVLLRLYPAQELAERDRLQRELDAQLVRRMLDLTDESARQTLTSLRAQLALAQARLDERSLRAPTDGVVGDIRVRPGQAVGPGDVLLSLRRDAAPVSVTVLLPGYSRPMLRVGGAVRLELHGFPYEYVDLTISEMADELVGPTEVRRYLGQARGDVVSLQQGSLVLVRAQLPSREFSSEGRTYRYHDGMTGTARARVGTRGALVALFPVLKPLWPSRE